MGRGGAKGQAVLSEEAAAFQMRGCLLPQDWQAYAVVCAHLERGSFEKKQDGCACENLSPLPS